MYMSPARAAREYDRALDELAELHREAQARGRRERGELDPDAGHGYRPGTRFTFEPGSRRACFAGIFPLAAPEEIARP